MVQITSNAIIFFALFTATSSLAIPTGYPMERRSDLVSSSQDVLAREVYDEQLFTREFDDADLFERDFDDEHDLFTRELEDGDLFEREFDDDILEARDEEYDELVARNIFGKVAKGVGHAAKKIGHGIQKALPVISEAAEVGSQVASTAQEFKPLVGKGGRRH